MRLGSRVRVTACTVALCLVGSASGGAVAAQSEADWALEYDKKANRFIATADGASICDRYGEGATMTDEGDGCWYAPTELGFLAELGFDGDTNGFMATDATDDVLVFMESRAPDQMRFDATGLRWAQIDATTELMQAAIRAPGAVTGEAVDMTPGPRVAMFVQLSEPPIWDGDGFALNVNSYTDDDVSNDMVRSLDPSFPSGGGDINVSVGWAYPEGEENRQNTTAVWSAAEQSVIPGNIVAGPSEDPPGAWAIIGAEHLGDQFNAIVLATPMFSPTLFDRVEGTAGRFGSFELDGNTQAYFDGFTMSGTANIPGTDFQLVFDTPYAPLFEGGMANIGFLTDTQEDSFSTDVETTDSTVSLGLSLPTGATGLTGIELVSAQKAKVSVDGQKKPVALKKWLKGDQLAEINEAVSEIMALSMSSRFDLADGQEVELGGNSR